MDIIKGRADKETSSNINMREDEKAELSENKMIGLVQKNTIIEVERLKDILAEKVRGILVTVRRSWREPRLLWKMLESKEYLAREELEVRVLDIFVTIVGGVKVPQIF